MTIPSPRKNFYRVASPVPRDWPDEEEHRRLIAEGAERALEGKIRSVNTVTLTENTTTTTLSDLRIGPMSFIGFMPTTANAAAEIGNGTLYVSARIDKSATLTHANNAQTDRTYTYVVLG